MPRIPRPTDHRTPSRPYHWSDDAACKGVDTADFFPASSSGGTAYAKKFCKRCPVQPDCLRHALTHREVYGVWGGLTEDERAELRRETRRTAERQRRQERERAKADASSAA